MASSSYSQILRASSITGASAAINMVLGMVRTKFAAIFLGTAGVGTLTSFLSIQSLLTTVSGIGIQNSAVREIAAAVARQDKIEAARIVCVLRRLCWITGIFGSLLTVLLSSTISHTTFGSLEYRNEIALLALAVLMTNIAGGEIALLQAMRKIGDLARANIFAATTGTIGTILILRLAGVGGVVPALSLLAFLQWAFTRYYSRQLDLPSVDLRILDTFRQSGTMVRLGAVFMWNGLLASTVAYATISLITHSDGLSSVGTFSAAFTLSGVLVNFVLGAMAADYFPRLTSLAHDRNAMQRSVNEQTEVGILLAAPGLIATIAFAPIAVSLFYTAEFVGAVSLLHWFVLGCLGRIVSWPLGFVMLALGKSRWYAVTETFYHSSHLGLITVGLYSYGVEGVAVAFFVINIFYVGTVYFVATRLIEFSWTRSSRNLIAQAGTGLIIAFMTARYLPPWSALLAGGLLTALAVLFSVRGLVSRLGPSHRLFPLVARIQNVLNFRRSK